MTKGIDKLIINSPYSEPGEHWSYHRETRSFSRLQGRRPAGYVVATPNSRSFDDPGIFCEMPLVNQIRTRVTQWRIAGYPGVTGITKRLLEHWQDPEQRQHRRFFFCQLEAIETLIWLTEAHQTERLGIQIPTDGGEFQRLCTKLATGSGKTIVMAMVITWHFLNKSAYPQDRRFSKNAFVVAPGLTVKNRLQVLIPDSDGNYFDQFNLVPTSLKEKLRQGRVLIKNWHSLQWDTEEQIAKQRSVDKRGEKSDEAYVREVLEDLSQSGQIIVLNDEAHHAWRLSPDAKVKGVSKADIDEATKWVGGLDRIHRARGILCCYDLSATPFMPSGKKSTEEALFDWVVSDFGLNDAIESGLVKTPRVVVRDDAAVSSETYKSRLYHIYSDDTVKDDLNRKADEHEPLPDLVANAYYLLGKDWLETKKEWSRRNFPVPPVMITVANRTETAARIKYSFDHKRILIDELCSPEKTLHIDSKVLGEAESANVEMKVNATPSEGDDEDADDDDEASEDDEGIAAPKLTKQQASELLRQKVDTVGQLGKPGEAVQNVISVGMLSEGWDAKTVTHIMGLRAFSSQLLCEQVVGRGLRRTAYEVNPETGLFDAEYVNIFGVPFTFLPHEGGDGPPPPPPPPKTKIEPLPERKAFEITFPNVRRVDHVFAPKLTLDLSKVKRLEIDASSTATMAELAPVLEGKPNVAQMTEIDLEDLGKRFRLQKILFEVARDIFNQVKPSWKGSTELLLGQVVGLVEKFLTSDRIAIKPSTVNDHPLRRRILLTINMNKIVQHLWEALRFENAETLDITLDEDQPIRSTGDMQTWYTSKPTAHTERSHISQCPFDSTWEATEAFILDHDDNVAAWVKNDHLGFEIVYTFNGVVHKYRPDFLIKLKTGKTLVLEVKGRDSQQNQTKRAFLDEWVRAVDAQERFGEWAWAVSFETSDIRDILAKHGRS